MKWCLPVCLLFWVVCLFGCGKPSSHKPVLHLFTHAASITGTATLHDIDDDHQPVSRISYPQDSTLWMVEHQGKQALRFESAILGQLRGSLHSFHQDISARDFDVSLNTWLEFNMEPAWTGVVFWMNDTIHQAIGVRWKADGVQKRVTLEIFSYRVPDQLQTLKSISFPMTESRWSNVKLRTQDQTVFVQLDELEMIRADIPEHLYWGNRLGLFQGEGTGYFADLQITANDLPFQIDVLDNWNNEILETAKHMMLNHLTIPENTLGLPVPVRRIKLADEWRSVVPVQCPSEIRIDVNVPRNARLHVGYGIFEMFALSSTKASLEVWVDDAGNETLLTQRTIQPINESARWFKYHDIHLSLHEYANQDVSILLRMKPLEGDEPLVICWSEPIITTNEKKEKPNVLLFMIDTLRADRLGVYGYEKNLTPIMDEFSKSGTTFLNTISQAPWTTPSHASLFTGLYPSETNCAHTSNSNQNLLREGYWTWAELLQENGYATSAFTSGLQVRGELGFHQGFDSYHEINYNSSYSIEAVYERFQSWLNEYDESPWFSFIQTYAVHDPYKHEQYDDYRTLVRSWEHRIQHQHDTYDGGVRFIDEWFGVFLRELERRGELENTIIILTSDHGESLGDRLMPRPAQHGHWLYDDLLKVPLIISAPKKIARNKVIKKQVRLIDVLPTVMDLVDIKTPDWCHGISTIPLIHGHEHLERAALSEGVNYGFPLRSLRSSTHKLIQLIDPNLTLDDTATGVPVPKPGSVQLYNIIDDPDEMLNIASTDQSKLDELNKVVEILSSEGFMLDPEFFNQNGAMQVPPQPSAEMMEQLNSLGYTSSAQENES